MPSDSGHSIEHSTNEAEERLLALEGDTADPLQGLMPVGPLVESANAIITPIPDPITPMPEVEDDGEVGDTPNPAQGLQPVEGATARVAPTIHGYFGSSDVCSPFDVVD